MGMEIEGWMEGMHFGEGGGLMGDQGGGALN